MILPLEGLDQERSCPLSVLVVEDDPIVLPFLRLALARLGYATLAAPDCASALATAEDPDVQIDAVLADIQLPDGNGGQVARRIRELRPEAGVVLMSGSPEQLAWAGGGDGSLTLVAKPFDSMQLDLALRAALDVATSTRPQGPTCSRLARFNFR